MRDQPDPPFAPEFVPEKAVQESIFFNKELSLLAFNYRVLQEADNARYPIL